MPLYLGVDGGQSSTRAIVGDDNGSVLGRGRAGPCNHVAAGEGRAKLVHALTDAVSQALAQAGRRWGEARFAAVCCGMSGGPADKREIIAELIPCERLQVVTDAHIALLGGTAGEPGVAVIAGTGSMALARDDRGRTVRAGGWGYLFGDEGGAFDITRRALQAALRAEEGWGPPTRLLEALLAETGAADANDLMHRFYTDEWPRQRVAALAPLVERAADAGDDAAGRVLAQAGADLARLATAARNQLFTPHEETPVAYIGGVFESPRVLASFKDGLALTPGCEAVAPRFAPDAGALLGAYRLAGLEVRPGRVS